MTISIEILVLFLLLLLNSLFVLSEMAVVSSRKARLQQQANEGDKRAGRALNLAQNPSTFLSTVQIGITLISILLGAVSGPMFSIPLAGILKRWPLLDPYADSLALVIVVIVITGLSLVVGELVPKRLALHNPEKIAAGQNPLQLDSKEPTMSFEEYAYGENRYKVLQKDNPEAAAVLMKKATAWTASRFEYYQKLAALSFEDTSKK